jgi:hypothetical protein
MNGFSKVVPWLIMLLPLEISSTKCSETSWLRIAVFTGTSGVAASKSVCHPVTSTIGVHQTECCPERYRSTEELEDIQNAFASLTPATGAGTEQWYLTLTVHTRTSIN